LEALTVKTPKTVKAAQQIEDKKRSVRMNMSPLVFYIFVAVMLFIPVWSFSLLNIGHRTGWIMSN